MARPHSACGWKDSWDPGPISAAAAVFVMAATAFAQFPAQSPTALLPQTSSRPYAPAPSAHSASATPHCSTQSPTGTLTEPKPAAVPTENLAQQDESGAFWGSVHRLAFVLLAATPVLHVVTLVALVCVLRRRRSRRHSGTHVKVRSTRLRAVPPTRESLTSHGNRPQGHSTARLMGVGLARKLVVPPAAPTPKAAATPAEQQSQPSTLVDTASDGSVTAGAAASHAEPTSAQVDNTESGPAATAAAAVAEQQPPQPSDPVDRTTSKPEAIPAIFRHVVEDNLRLRADLAALEGAAA